MNPIAKAVLVRLRREFEELYADRLAQIVLFGSQAREDAEPDSDIDVLVVLKDPMDATEEIGPTSAFVSDLCIEYDVVVSCLFMDEQQFLHRNGPLLRNVRREGVAV